jgi:hypothetical protein
MDPNVLRRIFKIFSRRWTFCFKLNGSYRCFRYHKTIAKSTRRPNGPRFLRSSMSATRPLLEMPLAARSSRASPLYIAGWAQRGQAWFRLRNRALFSADIVGLTTCHEDRSCVEGVHLRASRKANATGSALGIVGHIPKMAENQEIAPLERWQSGRMHRTRNAAYGQPYRGFESLPLRHNLCDKPIQFRTGSPLASGFDAKKVFARGLNIPIAPQRRPSRCRRRPRRPERAACWSHPRPRSRHCPPAWRPCVCRH